MFLSIVDIKVCHIIYLRFSLYASVLEEDTEDGNKRLIYEHKIVRGTSKVQNYGLKLASKTNLLENTVKLAMELAEVIAENEVVNIIIIFKF